MPPTGVVAAAFPGQGSLAPGVGAPWRAHPCFEVLETVGGRAGVDLVHLVIDGTEDELVSTRNAQLATYALSLAIFDATGLAGSVSWTLGHSLGEYSALVAAHVVDRDQGTALVDARGAAMLAASEAAPGGLVALIGGDAALAAAACDAIDGLYVANRNGPGQVVVGGTDLAIAALCDRVRELGFRRAIPLRVGGAFHTPLMAPAAPALAAALGATSFGAGDARVLANVDGEPHDDPADWPGLLLRQLTEPVDFERCVLALPEGSTFVECGPGGVLCGLAKRIRDDLRLVAISVPDELDSIGAT